MARRRCRSHQSLSTNTCTGARTTMRTRRSRAAAPATQRMSLRRDERFHGRRTKATRAGVAAARSTAPAAGRCGRCELIAADASPGCRVRTPIRASTNAVRRRGAGATFVAGARDYSLSGRGRARAAVATNNLASPNHRPCPRLKDPCDKRECKREVPTDGDRNAR